MKKKDVIELEGSRKEEIKTLLFFVVGIVVLFFVFTIDFKNNKQVIITKQELIKLEKGVSSRTEMLEKKLKDQKIVLNKKIKRLEKENNYLKTDLENQAKYIKRLKEAQK